MSKFRTLKDIEEIEKALASTPNDDLEPVIVDDRFIAVKVGKLRIASSSAKGDLMISVELD